MTHFQRGWEIGEVGLYTQYQMKEKDISINKKIYAYMEKLSIVLKFLGGFELCLNENLSLKL